jgi:hypothetical protein
MGGIRGCGLAQETLLDAMPRRAGVVLLLLVVFLYDDTDPDPR